MAWQKILCGQYPGTTPLELAIEAINKTASVDYDVIPDEFEIVKAEELLRGYDARWTEFVQSLDGILGVEVSFRYPLVNPETGAKSRTFELAGKIDVIIKWEGRVWIVEHKTSSEDITPGSKYWRRIRMDGQVSMYYDGAELALDYEVEGCLYDVLLRPGMNRLLETPEEKRQYTKPKPARPGKPCLTCKTSNQEYAAARGLPKPKVKDMVNTPGCKDCTPPRDAEPSRLYADQRDHDETVDEFRERVRSHVRDNLDRYFAHGRVVRLEDELEEFRFDLWRTAAEMRETEKLGHALRNPNSCVTVFGDCDYFDVCSGVAELDDGEQFYRLDNMHPELGEPEGPAQLLLLKGKRDGKEEGPTGPGQSG